MEKYFLISENARMCKGTVLFEENGSFQRE